MKVSSASRVWPTPVLLALTICAICITTAVLLRSMGGSVIEIGVAGGGGLAAALAVMHRDGVMPAQLFRRRSTRGATGRTEPAARKGTLDHFVEREFAAAGRGRRVTVVLFGFDQFDAFSRAHGSAAAETAVRAFGEILNRLTRKMNLSARYGWRSDTFLSVLTGSDCNGAAVFVENVQRRVHEARQDIPLPTVSAGIAEYHTAMADPEEFVRRAEMALELARCEGCGTVRVLAGDQTEDALAIRRKAG